MSTVGAVDTAGAGLAGFPFPFRDDAYRYSANVEPARTPVPTDAGSWGAGILDIDEHYHDELAARAAVLADDPSRCEVLPHMRPACWDALLTVLRELTEQYPGTFALCDLGDGRMSWRNGLRGTEDVFTEGDDASLPGGPLAYLGTQIQDDVVLLDQREGALWADAGLVTFAADWSLTFDIGMRFREIHGPVPRLHAEGIVSRAERFLMRLEPGQAYRRTNWTLSVDRRLDQSTEAYPQWGPARREVADTADDDDLARRLSLRVELQHLVRLGESGAILFLIRTYFAPLTELARVPSWRERTGRVLTELPDDVADYKGLTRFRERAARWLLSPVAPLARSDSPVAPLARSDSPVAPLARSDFPVAPLAQEAP